MSMQGNCPSCQAVLQYTPVAGQDQTQVQCYNCKNTATFQSASAPQATQMSVQPQQQQQQFTSSPGTNVVVVQAGGSSAPSVEGTGVDFLIGFLLAFFLELIGLLIAVLCLYENNKMGKRGAVVGCLVATLLYVVLVIVMIAMAASAVSSVYSSYSYSTSSTSSTSSSFTSLSSFSDFSDFSTSPPTPF